MSALDDDKQIVVPPQSEHSTMSAFDNDEHIADPPQSDSFVPGRVRLDIINNNFEAPLEENTQQVMLQLTGRDATAGRAGLDLVAVLDVSGSMQGDKINKMKTAMQFVINKLGPIDRLSIVTFSDLGSRLCKLRQITDTSQADLEKLINGLKASGSTNIGDGLVTGLKVIAERKFKDSRTFGLMLMSDGQQNKGGDAAKVVIGKVPVYTFGYGADHDPVVLNAVAKNSLGGMFSEVNDIDTGLSLAFSQCLAGLLTVVAQDLELTLERVDSTVIKKVTAGGYAQKKGDKPKPPSVTVSFGDLYAMEVRKVILDLVLHEVKTGQGNQDILKVLFSYSISGKPSDGIPQAVLAKRTATASSNPEPPPELETEQAHLETAKMIGEVMSMANRKELEEAREKVVEAQNALSEVVQQSSPLVGMLKTELKQFDDLMESQEVYEKQGRAYALSSLTSHERQRFAARGDIEKMRLFATPRMDKYLEQAKKFDKDPAVAPPSTDEDMKEEIATNPLGPIAGPIAFFIQAAITALKAIEKLFSGGAVA